MAENEEKKPDDPYVVNLKKDNKPEKPVNTKMVPALVALLAASISCIFSLLQRVSFSLFIKRFVIATLIFLVLGTIIKMLLDHSLKIMKESNPEDTVENNENQDVNLENISSENSDNESE